MSRPSGRRKKIANFIPMDIETILYLAFLIIFLIARVFRKAKERNQEQEQEPATVEAPTAQKDEKSLEDIFSDLLKEYEGKQEEQPPEPVVVEPEPEPVVQKPVFEEKIDTVPKADPAGRDPFYMTEGVSVFDDEEEESIEIVMESPEMDVSMAEIKDMGKETSQELDFDPREAFKLKILLENPHLDHLNQSRLPL